MTTTPGPTFPEPTRPGAPGPGWPFGPAARPPAGSGGPQQPPGAGGQPGQHVGGQPGQHGGGRPGQQAGGPFGAQSAGPPPGPGGIINFTVQGSVLTNNMVAPTVTLNGHSVGVPTGGTAPITAPPGRHQVEVVSQWLRAYGQASLTVDLQPGQRVDVFYAAPYHQFSKGAIGFEPQKRQGLGALLGILGGVVLLLLLLTVVPALLG